MYDSFRISGNVYINLLTGTPKFDTQKTSTGMFFLFRVCNRCVSKVSGSTSQVASEKHVQLRFDTPVTTTQELGHPTWHVAREVVMSVED